MGVCARACVYVCVRGSTCANTTGLTSPTERLFLGWGYSYLRRNGFAIRPSLTDRCPPTAADLVEMQIFWVSLPALVHPWTYVSADEMPTPVCAKTPAEAQWSKGKSAVMTLTFLFVVQ
jgi:hypothetical protein